MEHSYFAYGSNMNPERMRTRGLLFDVAEAAILHNYALRFNKRAADLPNASYANIVYAPGEQVEGVIYRLLNADEIYKMDPFEGAPRLYSRDRFTVVARSGERYHPWVYVANRAMIAEGLKPMRWYLEHLLAGEPYLSAAYHAQLQQVECHD